MPTAPTTKPYIVTVTDTFAGDLNYSWVVRYAIEATNPQQAVTRVKRQRYRSPVPRHRVECSHADFYRVDLVGSAVAITVELGDHDDDKG